MGILNRGNLILTLSSMCHTNLSGGKFAALLFESDVLPLAVLVLAVGLEDVEALLWKLNHSNIMHEKRKVCTYCTVAIRKS